MSSLITLSEITKQHGSQVLFKELSFSISAGDHIGVIGPNGAGKSTLMKIIAGEEEIDAGKIIKRNDLRIYYTAQSAYFDEDKSIYQYAFEQALKFYPYEDEADRVARNSLVRLKFDNFDLTPEMLSGGQKKRLQLALALCALPDLLILDEPTNHLDIESILILENILNESSFAWIVVSHDRWFLQQTAKRMLEVNQFYPQGIFVSDSNYDLFIDNRSAYIQAQENKISSMANVARRELEWLRQGVKARTTKAKYRIDSANNLLQDLSEAQSRTQKKNIEISFSDTDRKTKRLVELKNVSKSFDQHLVVNKFSFVVLSGQILGLLGKNGSGKSTIINLITQNIKPDSGSVNPAVNLSIAHFEQFSQESNPKIALKDILAPESDSVHYKGQTIHVASWAQRFGFKYEQLNQPYESLSGGERARARIAKLMLTTADLLILDEPTNDLDIETLEVLEQSLLEFSGAVILVTHDRYMISRLCSHYIGLDGKGGWQNYADYEQWQRELLASSIQSKQNEKQPKAEIKNSKKKLSYKEQLELKNIEKNIEKAENKVVEIQTLLNSNPTNLNELCIQLAESQKKVEELYSRWEELESLQK